MRLISMSKPLRSSRRPHLGLAVVLCLAGLVAAACSGGTVGTGSGTPLSPAPSQSTAAAPDLKPQVWLTASDGQGDKITGYVAFGPALPVTDTSLPQSIFSSCTGNGVLEPARTEVSQMRITLTGASSMPDRVQVIFNGGNLGYILGMSDGLQCASDEGPSYQTTLGSGQSDSMLIWLIYPGVLTPDHPRLTARQLGQQFADPMIYLSGGQATLRLTGHRASQCPGQIGEIIPAGSMTCQ